MTCQLGNVADPQFLIESVSKSTETKNSKNILKKKNNPSQTFLRIKITNRHGEIIYNFTTLQSFPEKIK